MPMARTGPVTTDTTTVLEEALFNLQAAIDESQADISRDALPSVVCDATQLMQLFQNLIGNAIRYRSDQPPQIHIGCDEEPLQWKFSVRDNGVGIDPRHQNRIFQVFQRLRRQVEVFQGRPHLFTVFQHRMKAAAVDKLRITKIQLILGVITAHTGTAFIAVALVRHRIQVVAAKYQAFGSAVFT